MSPTPNESVSYLKIGKGTRKMVMFYSKVIQGAQYYRSKVLKYQNKIGREGGELFLLFYEDDTTILRLRLFPHTD